MQFTTLLEYACAIVGILGIFPTINIHLQRDKFSNASLNTKYERLYLYADVNLICSCSLLVTRCRCCNRRSRVFDRQASIDFMIRFVHRLIVK